MFERPSSLVYERLTMLFSPIVMTVLGSFPVVSFPGTFSQWILPSVPFPSEDFSQWSVSQWGFFPVVRFPVRIFPSVDFSQWSVSQCTFSQWTFSQCTVSQWTVSQCTISQWSVSQCTISQWSVSQWGFFPVVSFPVYNFPVLRILHLQNHFYWVLLCNLWN